MIALPSRSTAAVLAQRVLVGGLAIYDRFGQHAHAPFRRVALQEKARALVNHDRLLTDRPEALR